MQQYLWKKIKAIFKKIHYFTNLVVNFIILSTLYFIGFGLTFLLTKLLRKQLIDMEVNKKMSSYWLNVDSGQDNVSNSYRQF